MKLTQVKSKYFIAILLIAVLFSAGFYSFSRKGMAFADTFKNFGKDPKQMRAGVEKCIRECPAWDAGLAQRLLGVMDLFDKDDSELPKANPILTSILTESIDHYTGLQDFDNLVGTYRMSFMHLANLKAFNTPDPAFERRVVDGVTNLKTSYPKRVEVYELAGRLSTQGAGITPEANISNFRDCLRVDPKHAYCMRAYDFAVKSYTKASCDQATIRSKLAFFVASHTAKNGFSTVQHETPSGQFYLEKSPSLAGQDLENIAPDTEEAGRIKLDFIFTQSGKDKLAKLSRAHIGENLAIVFDGKAFAVPMLSTEIKEGRMQMSLQANDENKKIFALMCPNPKPRELPVELRIN